MSKKIPSYAKNYKNYKVIIFNQDGTITTNKVYGIDGNMVETEEDFLRLEDAVKYHDITNGGFTYFYHLDVPAKVESENLKNLRRSVALKNLFVYDREKGFDIFKLMPYMIAVCALLF
jgi:hypothetical protein